jgi:uncharacterized small protein (DUF1192 family)
LRDSVELEWAGRPSAVIIADALVGVAEQMKRISAMQDYEYVVTPYPVGNLRPDELEQRAAQIAESVARLVFEEEGKKP